MFAFLKNCPGVGAVGARTLLRALGLSQTKTIRSLGPRTEGAHSDCTGDGSAPASGSIGWPRSSCPNGKIQSDRGLEKGSIMDENNLNTQDGHRTSYPMEAMATSCP